MINFDNNDSNKRRSNFINFDKRIIKDFNKKKLFLYLYNILIIFY